MLAVILLIPKIRNAPVDAGNMFITNLARWMLSSINIMNPKNSAGEIQQKKHQRVKGQRCMSTAAQKKTNDTIGNGNDKSIIKVCLLS